MEKEILEVVLKRNSKDQAPVKVVSVEIVPAVAKLAGFMSTVNRMNFKVILGNGRTVKRSLIIKTWSTDEFVITINQECRTFQNETLMYLMFKEFEYLMEEYQDTEDVIWGQMIHHIPYSCILMEDLKATGFIMTDMEKLFDLEQSLLSVHALGRYHGICKILEERGLLSREGFKPWFGFSEQLHQILYWETNALIEGIRKFWDSSWIPVIEKIKLTEESFSQRVTILNNVDDTKFNVLNHGDCHKHNIVFKYDWNKHPIAVRFVDFQMVTYGSPCIDLMYLVYTAMQPNVRRENFDLLMRTYHDSLINTLKKYQFKGSEPSIDEIKDGMEKHSFVGLHLFLLRYPTLFRKDEERDMDKIKSTEGREGFPDELYKPDRLVEAMGPDLKTYAESYF